MDENNNNNEYQNINQQWQQNTQTQQQYQQPINQQSNYNQQQPVNQPPYPQAGQYQQTSQYPQAQYVQRQLKPFSGTEKAISFVLGFFLGIIGVVVAWAVYKDGYDNPEGLKWSLIGMAVVAAFTLAILGFTTCGALSLASSYR